MENVNWAKFKSGSDIRGTASEGVEGQPIDLTDYAVERIVKGFAVFLSERSGKKDLTVSLGHDSRISAERLSLCVKKALSESGINVIFTGLSSTPAMFMTTKSDKIHCDGAIQLTASHHPFNKNGLKFFLPDGGLEGSDVSKILDYAEKGLCLSGKGEYREYDFMKDYSASLVDFVRKSTNAETPLKGMKIAVDAGNGAGGFFVNDVLMPLGADCSPSQFLEPDGTFPNHIPNPENETAMKSICDKVKESKSDFGIIFDTDVDRAGAVDGKGEEINRNRLIALISAILLEEKSGAYIVTDSVTSDGLAEFITNKGGIHHRYKRGYKNVINEAIKLNAEGKYCPLAIETSGHAALKENYFLDDGAYLITKLLIKFANLKKCGKDLFDLIKDLKDPTESAEIRMSFFEKNFKAYGKEILEEVTNAAYSSDYMLPAADNYEGIRISFPKDKGNGWLLLRMSLHDPIMPLNIESEEVGGTKIIARQLYELIKDFKGLNTENLKNFIE